MTRHLQISLNNILQGPCEIIYTCIYRVKVFSQCWTRCWRLVCDNFDKLMLSFFIKQKNKGYALGIHLRHKISTFTDTNTQKQKNSAFVAVFISKSQWSLKKTQPNPHLTANLRLPLATTKSLERFLCKNNFDTLCMM